MRTPSLAAVVAIAVVSIRCGGSGGPSHPQLDKDYSSSFVGTWSGPATLSFQTGQSETQTLQQPIDRTGVNRLALRGLCSNADGAAGLDSATTFSLDALTCAPQSEPCGPVTIRYASGKGTLTQGALSLILSGTASGCGQSVGFTLTFTGTLPVDHGPPSAVVAATSVDATNGVPVFLDASQSSDPDGLTLTFAWSIVSAPAGASPILSSPATTRPTFTATVNGTYVVKVVVTASDGQTAVATITITVHDPPAVRQTLVELTSDTGDSIGGGKSYSYSNADSRITVSSSGGHLSIAISGDETWQGEFQVPPPLSQIQPGSYSGLQRYLTPTAGGLDWFGEGRACGSLTGSFTVASATYTSGTLTEVELVFEQHCEGGTPALRGHVVWDASDSTQPPGPVQPPPAGLWQPAAGTTPASVNFVYLESDSGDFVGAGGTYTYTQADAVLSVSESGNHLSVNVTGDETWFGNFQGMSTIPALQPGYYPDLKRWPFHNPARGGLDWSGDGRGCNTETGWFVVDSITYANDTLSAIDLRFEQHCEGNAPALHGQVHWSAGDPTQPPGPIQPPPGLWQPAPGSTPATGSFVYLQSDSGDYIGSGGTFTYTLANSLMSLTTGGGHVGITVNGDEHWFGDFQAMSTLALLQPGYYGHLSRYPFQNPARGGLEWSGEGRGCNTLAGWFVVDAVTYAGTSITALDLRFEQRCDGLAAALHGQIHWDATDTTQPPGPVQPPPAGLWQPAAGSTPATGNYVYLQSDSGDYIGAGGTYTYTPADTVIGISAPGNRLSVSVQSGLGWSGDFQAMSTLAQLQPGYYGGLQRFPFHNPARGGLDWSGMGRGCNEETGWFVVDDVSYSNGALTAIDLRFEQHCEVPGAPPLHGQVHWTASGN